MTPPLAFTARTFSFACQVVRLYIALVKLPAFPWSLARQVLRAGTSIGANVEEARAASSRRDLIARFAIALREARETKYWLRLIAATGLAPATLVSPVLKEADELVAILTVSIRRLKAGS
jgi:four helix bundle protein